MVDVGEGFPCVVGRVVVFPLYVEKKGFVLGFVRDDAFD